MAPVPEAVLQEAAAVLPERVVAPLVQVVAPLVQVVALQALAAALPGQVAALPEPAAALPELVVALPGLAVVPLLVEDPAAAEEGSLPAQEVLPREWPAVPLQAAELRAPPVTPQLPVATAAAVPPSGPGSSDAPRAGW